MEEREILEAKLLGGGLKQGAQLSGRRAAARLLLEPVDQSRATRRPILRAVSPPGWSRAGGPAGRREHGRSIAAELSALLGGGSAAP
jgi:hypothetical protein